MLFLTFLLAPLALPGAGANHLQPLPSGGTVSFADKAGGNEWWVEAIVKSTTSVSKVEVMDTGGGWAGMAYHADWGTWAASYHVEAGHAVTFRATTANGVATSCPFTHPAGVEQCSTGPPPPTWTVTALGSTLGPSYDLAVGDADADGRRDVTLATASGVDFHEWTGSSWTSARVGDVHYANAVAVGDAGTGSQAAYVVEGSNLLTFTYANGAWRQQLLLTFPESYAGDMTVGDIDGQPGRELYVGMTTTDFDAYGLASSNSTLYRVRLVNGAWTADTMLHFFGSVDSMWIGDGDRDGTSELYLGHGTRHAAATSQVKLVGGSWRIVQIGGAGSEYGTSYVVVGDADRDGKQEVYSMTDQLDLRRQVFANGVWTQEYLLSGVMGPNGYYLSPYGLFLGDGDADGSQELYFGTASGEVEQVRYDGSQWKATQAARLVDPNQDGQTRVVVGDIDGNGRPEVYAATGAELWQLAVPGAFVTTTPGFDAAFTGVRGNEYWLQANVAATGGTVGKVDVALNNGAWQPLTKQSWGGWAASYHAVQGTVVRLRATSTAGATDLSDCYQWVPASNSDASKRACTGTPPPPPPPPAFDATFSGAQGNEWWEQVNVAANQPVAQVMVRLDCSITWLPLSKQSWGGWAASYHAPAGTRVDFEARTSTYASDVSGTYLWTSASPTTACPQGDWPRQGSFVEYAGSNGVCGGGNCFSTSWTWHTTYAGGAWTATCNGRDVADYNDGTHTETPWGSGPTSGMPPPRLPTNPHNGDAVHPAMVAATSSQCRETSIQTDQFVQGTQSVNTQLKDANGNPVSMTAWYAQSTDPQANFYVTHWDTKVGLVLDIHSYPRMSEQGSESMYITDTDAPIR